MSVSSYGHVINAGLLDPFNYGLPSLQESSEDMLRISNEGSTPMMYRKQWFQFLFLSTIVPAAAWTIFHS